MTDLRIYRCFGHRIELGPLHAHQVDDIVRVPDRDLGWPHREHRDGGEYVIREVHADGAAIGTRIA
jgi:hypothetical protein